MFLEVENYFFYLMNQNVVFRTKITFMMSTVTTITSTLLNPLEIQHKIIP